MRPRCSISTPPLYAHALALNGSGSAYVTGDDEFVQELNSSGAVIFSTTVGYGGAATSIAVQNGLITLAGQGNPPGTANFGNDFNGMPNFIMRMNGSGNIVYSALIHDSNMTPKRLALDSAGEVFLTGRLNATEFRTDAYSNAPFSGAFLLRLNATGTALLLYSAFGGDTGYGVAVDRAWNAFVVGGSISGEYYPLTSNAFQSSFKSAHAQGFLSKLIIEADVKMLIQEASPNPVSHGSNLTYTLAVFNNGPDVSDGDTVTDVLPSGTTFVSFSNTNGTCTHPAVGSGGIFKCTRSTTLSKGAYWGPIKLTVHVNVASGSTITNTASVAAKTQDVVPSNNSATVSVHVQ